jgi:ABC-type multidrug transport system permease subunit
MWASFVAIFRKEFLHVLRDRGTLALSLAIPLFQLVLFGFIDMTVRDLPTVVVDQDHSTESRAFADELRATRTFKVARVTSDAREARGDITAGRARIGVVIPPDFHDRRARKSGAKVLVLIDGSDSQVSSQALAAVNGLASQVTIEDIRTRAKPLGFVADPALSVQPVLLFNPSGRTANFIIPGLVGVMLQMVATLLTAVALVRERERGTLEQLLVTPVHATGLMFGKIVPYLFIGILETAVILAVMRFGFDVPIRGNLGFLFVIAVVYLFATLSMGMFISTIATTQAQAQQMTMFFVLPSVFLSGYIFPQAGLPRVLYWLGETFPATHMIAIMRGIVLREAGPRDLVPNIAALVAISVILVTLSVRRFQRLVVS